MIKQAKIPSISNLFKHNMIYISSTFREVLISINNKLVQHRVARMMVNDSKPKIPI